MFTKKYVLIENDVWDGICEIYSSKADAEEALFTECEWRAYEVLMTDDSYEVFGRKKWNYTDDFWTLMNECARAFEIREAKCFG